MRMSSSPVHFAEQRFGQAPGAPERLPGSQFGGQKAHLWPRPGFRSNEPDPPPAAPVGRAGGEANPPDSGHAKRALREWSACTFAHPTSLRPGHDSRHQSSRQPIVLRPDRPLRCARQGRSLANRAPAREVQKPAKSVTHVLGRKCYPCIGTYSSRRSPGVRGRPPVRRS